MQCVRSITTAVVLLVSGTLVLGYAQQDQKKERQGKPEARHSTPHKPASTEAKPQHSQSPPQHQQVRGREPQGPPQRRVVQEQKIDQAQEARRAEHRRVRQQAAKWQNERAWARQGAWRGGGTWRKNRAQHWEAEHRTWAQRGGYGGYHISPATFKLHFGSQHPFRMRGRPTIYLGYPRFVYGGFSFLLVDPWPESWADNWYAEDDVYVDYDDGYYLVNRRFPNFRLAVMVVL